MATTEEKINKQEAEQAPVPPAPAFIKQAIEDSKPKKLQPKDEDDKILAEGSDSTFWKLVKQRIDGKIEGLEATLAGAVQNRVGSEGIWLQDIGIRYLLKQVVTDNLKDIINFVELRRRVAEEQKIQKANERKQEAESQTKS